MSYHGVVICSDIDGSVALAGFDVAWCVGLLEQVRYRPTAGFASLETYAGQ